MDVKEYKAVSERLSFSSQTRLLVEMSSKASSKKSDISQCNPAPTLFNCIIRMIAVAEGDILRKTSPEFDSSINDISYGILINGSKRLIYDKDVGLDIVSLSDGPLSLEPQ